MVKLRLFRTGCHKNPSYRVVVADSKAKANGSYIELVGLYDSSRGTHKLDEYLCIKWLANGAQPSDTVKSFLSDSGIWKKYIELKQKKLLEKYLAENAPVKQKKSLPVKKEVKKSESKPASKKPEIKKVEEVKKPEPVKKEEKPKKPEPKLEINKNSKLVSKVSEEEVIKRQTQKFEVVEEVSVKEETPSTIIISLDKEQIENIINNEKEIIYFKRLPIHKFSRVLVYSKKPIGMVVGEFEVNQSQVLKKTPAWKNYGSKSIFSKKEFDEYYRDQEDAKIMEIKGFILYTSPRKLSDFKLSKGPSGFSYLK